MASLLFAANPLRRTKAEEQDSEGELKPIDAETFCPSACLSARVT